RRLAEQRQGSDSLSRCQSRGGPAPRGPVPMDWSCSVRDSEAGAAMRGRLDLVDQRDREVRAGELGGTVLIGQQHVAAEAVGTGPLPRCIGAEARGGAHEEPVQTLA